MDNRFMADMEGTQDSKRTYTTFKILSEGEIYPGMLLVEKNTRGFVSRRTLLLSGCSFNDSWKVPYLMFATYKSAGVYLKCMSNLSSLSSDGSFYNEHSAIWSGKSKFSTFSITGGLVINIAGAGLCLGGGFWDNKICWETKNKRMITKDWATFSDFATEVNLIIPIKRFCLTGGYSYCMSKSFGAINIGIGYKLNK